MDIERQMRMREVELNRILDELSDTLLERSELSYYIERFMKIYNEEDHDYPYMFRQSYGTISGKALSLNDKNPNAIDHICANLSNIQEVFWEEITRLSADISGNYLEIKEKGEVFNKINRLLDHISLEQIRIQLVYKKYEQKIEEIEEQAQKSLETYRDACKLSKEAIQAASNIKMEVVTILGIFAAIVLAFMGGINFSSSTIESIAKSPDHICEIVVIATICGFVVFNTIFVLMHVVSKIVGKPISEKCKTDDCNNCQDTSCWSLRRIRRKLPYVFWVNIMILGILLTACFAAQLA